MDSLNVAGPSSAALPNIAKASATGSNVFSGPYGPASIIHLSWTERSHDELHSSAVRYSGFGAMGPILVMTHKIFLFDMILVSKVHSPASRIGWHLEDSDGNELNFPPQILSCPGKEK